MFSTQTVGSNRSSRSNWVRRLLFLLIAGLLSSLTTLNAQQLTGTLSGIAMDQSDARVPNASVVVKNQATGDTRTTKADGQGFFSVTALIPGSYTVTISAQGFTSWEENGIVVNQGDSRTIANIHLKVGGATADITVISGADAEVPTDTAEVSDTLNNELVDSAVLTGRNAAELIKMMPGVAFNNGGGAGSGYNSQVTGTNNGPAGSFSANGTQPYGSTVVMLDGANLLDPGNAGTQVANINQDMTDSVKYLSASYGAEYAKGPAVLQAFSKSGGQKFHGEAYLYARNTAIGYANDWNAKFLALSGNKKPILQPQSFYYIGGNVGGPISFLGFNKNKDKLFFWGGYEKMIQHPYSSPVEMNVPTDAQRAGDFNLDGSGGHAPVPSGVLGTYGNAYALPCSTDNGWQGCSSANSPFSGYGKGTVPNVSAYFDPQGVAVTNMLPKANQTPNAANGQNNFSYAPSLPQNRWEATGKVTYAFNDNNKLWGSYAYQSETDDHPLSIWWTPEWTVPYPGNPVGKETADVYLVNYTHVFSPTSTNEVVFAYSKFVNNNSLQNASAVSRTKLGIAQQSLFGAPKTDQIANYQGQWNDGIPWINEFDFNSGIYGKGTFGKTSKAPSIADTFTKIVKTHSLKAGFYWDAEENLQSNGSNVNGTYSVSPWSNSSTYNETLDRLMGRNANYDETNLDAIPDIIWHQWSLWAQDSWKATSKLTVNVGLRADHEGQWYDKIGGTQVWDPASYDNSPNAAPNTGLKWHKIDPSIPNSGWKSRLFYYDPRVGVAYDLFGTGRTVIRAGFGTYRYQVSGNDGSQAMAGPLGSFDYSTGTAGVPAFYGYQIQGGTVYTGDPNNNSGATTRSFAVPQGVNQNHVSGVKADQKGDDQVPFADTYSFGVAQALPSHIVAEVSYVGSASRNQLLNGGNGHINDPNAIANGAFYKIDPISQQYENQNPVKPGCENQPTSGACPAYAKNDAVQANDWRPLRNYGNIWMQSHGGYANYNSLQVSAQKQSGNLYLFSNFTFGKVLGTRDGNTNNGNGNGTVVDPYNLSNNYGPLGYDHTKIFNFSASYKLPKLVHSNWLAGEVVNGWQITTYTTYQDGSPYQAGAATMNMNYQQHLCGDNDSWVGSDGVTCAQKGKGNTVNNIFQQPLSPNATGKIGSQNNQVVGNYTGSISTTSWFGQAQGGSIMPLLTCDPRKGLKSGQYFNPNCFAGPLPPTANSTGQNGPWIWPMIRNPHYFGSDLAVFKAFRINDAQRVEIRISATNWLNHPNAVFSQNGNTDNTLLFNGLSSSAQLTRNSNAATTGTPGSKVGYRWMQFAAKYYF